MIHFPQRKERKEKRELKVNHILISSHIPSLSSAASLPPRDKSEWSERSERGGNGLEVCLMVCVSRSLRSHSTTFRAHWDKRSVSDLDRAGGQGAGDGRG